MEDKETGVEVRGDGQGTPQSFEEVVAHDALKGVAGEVEEFMQYGAGSMSAGDKLGVLQRIVTAVAKDSEYRQILLLAAFDNKQEAMLASDAITERQRYGVTIQPILDRLVAQCAVKSGRVDKVLHAMTNYTLNTGFGGKLPFWKKKQESKGISM